MSISFLFFQFFILKSAFSLSCSYTKWQMLNNINYNHPLSCYLCTSCLPQWNSVHLKSAILACSLAEESLTLHNYDVQSLQCKNARCWQILWGTAWNVALYWVKEMCLVKHEYLWGDWPKDIWWCLDVTASREGAAFPIMKNLHYFPQLEPPQTLVFLCHSACVLVFVFIQLSLWKTAGILNHVWAF